MCLPIMSLFTTYSTKMSQIPSGSNNRNRSEITIHNPRRHQSSLFRGRSLERNLEYLRSATFLADEVVNAMLTPAIMQSLHPEYTQMGETESFHYGIRYPSDHHTIHNFVTTSRSQHDNLTMRVGQEYSEESQWFRQELEQTKNKQNEPKPKSEKPHHLQDQKKFLLKDIFNKEEEKYSSNSNNNYQEVLFEFFDTAIENELKTMNRSATNNYMCSCTVDCSEMVSSSNEQKCNAILSEAISKFVHSETKCPCFTVIDKT